MNTRYAGPYGYSLAKVLLGFQPRCFGDRHIENELLAEAIRGDKLAGQEPGPRDFAQTADVYNRRLEHTQHRVRTLMIERH
mgnify:CR=1 FL=1